MPHVEQVIPQLESVIATSLRGTRVNQKQGIQVWLQMCKDLMRSTGLREATDWVFTVVLDTVAADTQVDSSGGTVYAVLVDSIYDTAAVPAVISVADSGGSAVLQGSAFDMGVEGGATHEAAILKVNDSTTADEPFFACAIYPMGLVMPNDIHASADGEDDNAPVTNDIRTYILYRSTVEVQVG